MESTSVLVLVFNGMEWSDLLKWRASITYQINWEKYAEIIPKLNAFSLDI